jgi:uroporphyrinogen-III synthase
MTRRPTAARSSLVAMLAVAAVASIGPTASERLRHHGLPIDFEPSHPKMGILVKEISEQIYSLREAKIAKQL